MFFFAAMYYAGSWVSKDFVLAYKLFSLSTARTKGPQKKMLIDMLSVTAKE
jgi:TPR repeat protein